MHVKFLAVSVAVFLSMLTTSLRSETELSENHLLYQIMENESYCVEQYSEEKIFLKPENIIFSRNGLLLNLNGYDLVSLPQVVVTHLGFYIEKNFWASSKKEKPLGPCPHCGEDTDGKGICRNYRCEFYRIKVLFKSDWER